MLIQKRRYKKDQRLYYEKKRKKLEKHYEILHDKQKDNVLHKYKENIDMEIVDIVKPIGQWTKMVMQKGGLLLRLAQLIKQEGGKKGFWELFVKAQSSQKGKHKGRQR